MVRIDRSTAQDNGEGIPLYPGDRWRSRFPSAFLMQLRFGRGCPMDGCRRPYGPHENDSLLEPRWCRTTVLAQCVQGPLAARGRHRPVSKQALIRVFALTAVVGRRPAEVSYRPTRDSRLRTPHTGQTRRLNAKNYLVQQMILNVYSTSLQFMSTPLIYSKQTEITHQDVPNSKELFVGNNKAELQRKTTRPGYLRNARMFVMSSLRTLYGILRGGSPTSRMCVVGRGRRRNKVAK